MKDLMDAMREEGLFVPPPESASSPDVDCCGAKPAPPAGPHERPGYVLQSFVRDFLDTPAGPVPLVATELDQTDRRGALLARLGPGRDSHRVAPGLYAAGAPDPDCPVLVTANYKLSFDALRKELAGLSAWILVLDTRGVNVWCAAGKKTFSTAEVAARVRKTGLERVVRHRTLILPQLSATGVAAKKLKKLCGFKAVFGPVRAADLPAFLQNGLRAEPAMRRATFSLRERAVLTPVELYVVRKELLWVLAGLFLLSGIGPSFFSPSVAWTRFWPCAAVVLAGLAAGAVVTPLALPWLPGRALSLKGALAGAPLGLLALNLFGQSLGRVEGLAALALCLAAASYAAMNFTGATPYCSPSGVEKEMRRFLPLQAGAALVGLVAWVVTGFTG